MRVELGLPEHHVGAVRLTLPLHLTLTPTLTLTLTSTLTLTPTPTPTLTLTLTLTLTTDPDQALDFVQQTVAVYTVSWLWTTLSRASRQHWENLATHDPARNDVRHLDSP